MNTYQLIRNKDNKRIFSGAYVKHLMDGAFCAILEEYPSDNTKVLLCRRVNEREQDFGYLLCRLVKPNQNADEKVIGFYVTMGTVRSEQEAIERLKAIFQRKTANADQTEQNGGSV